MIIVEGPDGAGKTTLIQNLSKALGVEVSPRACTSEGGPIENLWEWTTDHLNDKAENLDKLTLHDRHPMISEPIYGPLIRGVMHEGFNSPWYGDAWRVFTQIDPLIIFCLPSVDTVISNVDKEDVAQMDGVNFNIRAIYWLYYNLMTRLRGTDEIKTAIWDYQSGMRDQDFTQIVHYIQRYAARRAFQ